MAGYPFAFQAWLSFYNLKIFLKSVTFIFKSLIGLNGEVVAPLSHLKTRSDWRDFFEVLSSKHFLFVSGYLEGKSVRVRLGHHVDHWLIGSTKLVLYNAHRCFLHIGEDQSKEFPKISHLPPITLRDLRDDTKVLTILELWALSPSSQVVAKVESNKHEYLVKLQSMRY